MAISSAPRTAPRSATTSRGPGHDPLAGGLRFLSELVAWVATPWALWSHSPLLAVASVVLMIGLPAVLSTPGDRPGGDGPVAVPGVVTVLLLVAQLVAAAVSAWVLWPQGVAIAVTALCLVVPVTERPRWRSLLRRTRSA